VLFDGRFISALALTGFAMSTCISACTVAPGTPTAAPTSNPTGSTVGPTSTSTAPVLPPRPREIQIGGIDPCALWSPEQLGELHMPQQPSSRTDDQGQPWCYYTNRGQPEVAYAVKPRLDRDVTAWLRPGQVEETSVVTVAGFPAVQLHGQSASIGCDVLVSTSKGQYLQIKMSSIHYQEFTIQQMCELATKAATLATQTLQTLR
jgi:Protein of unknown function (DUF3558)